MDGHLWFGELMVGKMEGVFFSDHNGYAVLHPSPELGRHPELAEINAYIAFSRDWNWRTAHDDEEGVDAEIDEWDPYLSLARSPLWRLVTDDGRSAPVREPVFREEEVSWEAPAEHWLK